jgi:hypothetical protein
MKDIVVIDHLNLIGGEKNIDEETRKSYNEMASRLRKLAKRNTKIILRKKKIKRICQN